MPLIRSFTSAPGTLLVPFISHTLLLIIPLRGNQPLASSSRRRRGRCGKIILGKKARRDERRKRRKVRKKGGSRRTSQYFEVRQERKRGQRTTFFFFFIGVFKKESFEGSLVGMIILRTWCRCCWLVANRRYIKLETKISRRSRHHGRKIGAEGY